MIFRIAPWCTACGNCILVCPARAIRRQPAAPGFHIAGEICTECTGLQRTECERHCPSEAILHFRKRLRLRVEPEPVPPL